MNKVKIIVAAAVVLLIPLAVLARVGVGVGLGKIYLDQSYKAGGSYELSVLPVINTGDESADYEVTVEFLGGIPQLMPKREWFKFEPQSFHLEPGKTQAVQVFLTLPLKTPPGDYFAFLEGHPVDKKLNSGGTVILVAAATKLYFSIAPANVWQGLYYRLLTLWQRWAPWTWIVIGTIGLAVLIIILRRHVSLDIGISRKR